MSVVFELLLLLVLVLVTTTVAAAAFDVASSFVSFGTERVFGVALLLLMLLPLPPWNLMTFRFPLMAMSNTGGGRTGLDGIVASLQQR